MGTGGDNRGLYLKALMDSYVASIPAPSYKNFDRDEIMKQFGNGIFGLTKEIDDTDSPYTITDTDGISNLICDTSSGNVTVNLPTLADNFGRSLKVINESGANDVNVNPEGTEKINNYDSDFIITEDFGFIDLLGSANQWNANTDGWSSILYVGTETPDTGLTTISGNWDDVNLGSNIIIPTKGKWLIDVALGQRIRVSTIAEYILVEYGIGETSGNNAPDLIYKFTEGFEADADRIDYLYIERVLNGEPIEITSDSKQIYLKSRYLSDETATQHYAFGTTDVPMFVRARRIK